MGIRESTKGKSYRRNTHPDHSSSSSNNQQLVAQHFSNDENSPAIISTKEEAIVSRGVDNQAYYVLGHKTANVHDLYEFGHELQREGLATTCLCIEIATGIEYASKSISKGKLTSEVGVEDLSSEIQIMHHFAGHRNIVTIMRAYEDPLDVHIVMDLCSGGDLFDGIIRRGHYTERKAAELMGKIIVEVVDACDSLGVMLRNLKPESFLLLDKYDDSSLKAFDFRCSVFFKPGQVFTDMGHMAPSAYYMAPEVLHGHYGAEADIWSAVVILYIWLSGVPPFWAETQQGIFDAVLMGDIDFESNPWPSISVSAMDLIRKMLCSQPSERLTAHEVLCHPWICQDGVAPDRAPDPVVLSRLKWFFEMKKLKKMALRVIAESLPEEELAGLREIFKAMDTNNSGEITFDKLKAGLRRYGSILRNSEILHLMEAMRDFENHSLVKVDPANHIPLMVCTCDCSTTAEVDVDDSETINYGKFIAATIPINKLERRELLVAAFQYFDKDGNGYITIDDLQQACEEHNMSGISLEDIEDTIRNVDQDNDGRIDYREFVALMEKGNGRIGRQIQYNLGVLVAHNRDDLHVLQLISFNNDFIQTLNTIGAQKLSLLTSKRPLYFYDYQAVASKLAVPYTDLAHRLAVQQSQKKISNEA